MTRKKGLSVGQKLSPSRESEQGPIGLAEYRRSLNRRVVAAVLATLTSHQRELLGATVGNPNIEHHVERLITALLAADANLNIEAVKEGLSDYEKV